jgi:hypothetical protein
MPLSKSLITLLFRLHSRQPGLLSLPLIVTIEAATINTAERIMINTGLVILKLPIAAGFQDQEFPGGVYRRCACEAEEHDCFDVRQTLSIIAIGANQAGGAYNKKRMRGKLVFPISHFNIQN